MGTFVQCQYRHGKLPVLALNGANTGVGIYAFWSNTSIGTVHYRYWHLMVPVPVMEFMHFSPLPVSARYIIGTGIKWCQYRYWHICTFVQYQYWHGTLPLLAFNGASTGNVNKCYVKSHKIYASTSIVPPFSGELLELVICTNWYPVVE